MEEKHVSESSAVRKRYWPALPVEVWLDTINTLHMWTQIVGKIRLAQSPWVNHSWHVTLYVSPRGLTTSPIPHGDRLFQIDFDFIDHRLVVSTSEGEVRSLPLESQTTANFHASLMATLDELCAAGEDPLTTQRGGGGHALRRGHPARILRSRRSAPLLACPLPGRSRLQSL